MKIGFSSYSFHQRLGSGQMDVFDVIDWVADNGGEHLEFAAIYPVDDSPLPTPASDPEFVAKVKAHAAERGVPLSNLAIGANFLGTDEERRTEIDRVKTWVDLAAALGIERMRHDVVGGTRFDGDDSPQFDEALPQIVAAAKEIAQYAAPFGITTSLENHGYFVQASERVRRIVRAVDEPNFATTLDVGNFVCVDEDPTAAVPANLPIAMIVHFKDFYIRPADTEQGQGWFRSRAGKHLRGAIVGNGDLDLTTVATAVRESGYDGYVSIEFEGQEDCLTGCLLGAENARRLLGVSA